MKARPRRRSRRQTTGEDLSYESIAISYRSEAAERQDAFFSYEQRTKSYGIEDPAVRGASKSYRRIDAIYRGSEPRSSDVAARCCEVVEGRISRSGRPDDVALKHALGSPPPVRPDPHISPKSKSAPHLDARLEG